MTQTRIGSFIEAVFNVVIGFGINFAANLTIFPLFGWNISAAQNLALGAIYTVISIVRSYAIRRWFNSRLKAAAQRVAGRVPR
jgi:type IV secretory pathway protease TraF